MKTKTIKRFHAVKFQRKQRRKLYEIIKHMTPEERVNYFKKYADESLSGEVIHPAVSEEKGDYGE